MKRLCSRFAAFAGLAGLLLVAGVAPAFADAIDGHWCFKDGRRMHIDGPRITIPSGKRITGDYDRHGFEYVIPPGEKGAGGKIVMRLQSDEFLTVMPPGGGRETWQRCKKGVS